MGSDERLQSNVDKVTDRAPSMKSGGDSHPVLPLAAPLVATGRSRGGYLTVVSVICFLWVAFTSPFNITILVLSSRLLERCFGGYVADNSTVFLIGVTMLIQTALFTGLWLPVVLITKEKSLTVQNWSVVALTGVYLGFWTGWTIWLAAEMTRTNAWP